MITGWNQEKEHPRNANPKEIGNGNRATGGPSAEPWALRGPKFTSPGQRPGFRIRYFGAP